MQTQTTTPSTFKAWLLAARPKTLTAALVPILTTSALIHGMGKPVLLWVSWLALLSSFCIQIATNLVNDAADFKKGADTSDRIGPLRVTQMGYFTAKQVMEMAALVFGIAMLFGFPLVLEGGWPILAIGILSILFGYGYTSGPFPLAYLGLGDLFVIIFFGFVAVCGLFFIHTKTLAPEAFILSLQVGFHATVLIAINNLRDLNQDAKVNKKTLAVKLGKQGARYEIAFLIFAPFLISIYWLLQGYTWAFYLSLLPLPLAFKLAQNIFTTEPGRIYNKFLGMGAGLHLLFAICLSLGLFLK